MTESKSNEFACLLRLLRKGSGLKNRDFAKKCGTTAVQIWRWETGVCQPTIEAADRILRKFGKTLTLGDGR